MIGLNPYLMFNGNCKEAMEYYKSVFGGELTVQTYGESGQPKSDETKDLIMHAMLKNDSLTLMASDGTTEREVKMGDNVRLSLSGDDEAVLKKYFDGLSKGGTMTVPLAKAPWGDTFGMFVDKFGIHWMVNITTKSPQQ